MDRRIKYYYSLMGLLLVGSVVCGGDYGQCWVATAIGAGLGVLSSLWGGAAASSASRKAKRELERSKAEEDAWYARRYNQNYADTAAGQNLLTKARDFAAENWRRASGASRVAGASASSAARAKEQGVKMVGQTIGQMAANDTARKDAVDMAHRTRNQQISAQKAAIENQRAQNITAAAGQASNALIGAGALIDSGGGLKKSKIAKDPSKMVIDTSAVPKTNEGYVPTMYDYEENPNKWLFGDDSV